MMLSPLKRMFVEPMLFTVNALTTQSHLLISFLLHSHLFSLVLYELGSYLVSLKPTSGGQ